MKFLNFLFLISFRLFYQKSYSEIKIDVDHVIIQDHHSGKILFEKDADELKFILPL